MRHLLFSVFVAAMAGCGGSMPAGGGGGGGMGNIPDPGTGNGVDQNFGNVEPNDTPATATPLGVAMGADVYVWVNGNMIGGGDDTDYFVFKTGAKAGQFSLGQSGLCWSGAISNLSATLWKVQGGNQVMPPVHQWMGNNKCVQSMMGDAPLEASTEYLLGVTAMGGGGMYAA